MVNSSLNKVPGGFGFARLAHSGDATGCRLTGQLPCGYAVGAGSASKEARLALRGHPHETASGAQTAENPTRQNKGFTFTH